MDFVKACAIAKLLTKESVLNPITKKHRVAGALVIAFVLFAIVVLTIALVVSPPKHVAHEESLGTALRKFLLSMGLDKEKIVDVISAILTLYLLSQLLRGGNLVVTSEAVKELVLSQPIDMSTFILGYALHQFIYWAFISILPCFSFIPLILDLNGGSPKALLLPLAFLTIEPLFIESTSIFSIATIRFLERRGALVALRIAVAIYLLAALMHSILIRGISPLLAAPLRSFAEFLVYPATISMGWSAIEFSMVKSYACLAAIFAVIATLGNELTPEDVVAITEIHRERRARVVTSFRLGRSLLKARMNTPESAVRSLVLGMSVASPGHLAKMGIIIAFVAGATYLAKAIATAVYGSAAPLLSSAASYIITPVILVTSIAAILESFVEDISGYWVYRVYLARMDSVATNLLAKYAVYIVEALLILSIFDCVRTGSTLYLLLPLMALPIALIASFLALLIITYFASKRKIVKQLHGTMTVLENVVGFIVFGILFFSTFILKVTFDLTIVSVKHPGTPLIISTATSIAISIPLLMLFSKILAKAMERYDLAW